MKKSPAPRKSLQELRRCYVGATMTHLVQRHLDKQGPVARRAAIDALTCRTLPAALRPLARPWMDRWCTRASDPAFWSADLAALFDEITDEAAALLRQSHVPATDELTFDLFNLVVLKNADRAELDRSFRKRVGLRKGFYWPRRAYVSAVAVLAVVLLGLLTRCS